MTENSYTNELQPSEKKNPENAQKLNPENKWGEKNSMTNVEKINQKQTKNSAIENKPNVTQK